MTDNSNDDPDSNVIEFKPHRRLDPVDRQAEIERLAALDPIDYEVARGDAAKATNLRAHVLDKAVATKRRELGLHDDDTGQGRIVKIDDALPWHEPVDGDELVTLLTAAIKTYVILPDHAAIAIAIWVLHTWTVNNFTISPRLAITSPTKGCGKTTVLRLLDKVARRAKRAGSISPPALFRAVEQLQPTVLLDETEKYIEHGSDLHALLNEGHCKGATVLRVLGDKLELVEFSIFGAVAFCRNGKLPDDLEQRSIVIEMQRRLPGEPLAELRDDRCEALDTIGRKCARWADDHVGDLKDTDPDMGDLINRQADNWRPLFAIAEIIGSDWPERIRQAAKALAPREADSTGTVLLADLKAVFDAKFTDNYSFNPDRLSSAELCDALAAIEGRPWAEWKGGKAITPNQLARLLKPFSIAPENVRVGGKVPKGYVRHRFEEAWQRYLLPQGVNEPLQRYNPTAVGTSATFQSATQKNDVAVQKCEKSLGKGHCSGVAVQRGEDATSRACAQCNAGDDGTMRQHDGVWLHPECIRFFKDSNGSTSDTDDSLEIPPELDRRERRNPS